MPALHTLPMIAQTPPSRLPLHDKTIVITGASTGLGLEITKQLLQKSDFNLILTARQSSLERFEGAGIVESDRVLLRPLDVTSHRQRKRLVREVEQRFGGIDVLINNAGLSYRSVLEHVTEKEHRAQMEVNYLAPMALARLALPLMRRRRCGHIIQISSAGGLMAMPTMGIYAASKFALEAATESLYYEVKPFGIRVNIVAPGFINSDGIEKVRLSGQSKTAISDDDDPYHQHYQSMASVITRASHLTPATPEKVARRVCKIVARPPRRLRIPATFDTHLLWLFRRLTPQIVYHWILCRAIPGLRHWGKSSKPQLPMNASSDEGHSGTPSRRPDSKTILPKSDKSSGCTILSTPPRSTSKPQDHTASSEQ